MARTGTTTRERSTTRADRTNGQSRRQEKTAKLTLEELVRQTARSSAAPSPTSRDG